MEQKFIGIFGPFQDPYDVVQSAGGTSPVCPEGK
jgi:hypothetical protein